MNNTKELYKQQKYDECLEVLYRTNIKTKLIVWGLVLFSLLLDGLSLYLSNYDINNISNNISVVAGGIVGVAGVAAAAIAVVVAAIAAGGIVGVAAGGVVGIAAVAAAGGVAIGGVAVIAVAAAGGGAIGVAIGGVVVIGVAAVAGGVVGEYLIKLICRWSLK